MRLTRPACFRGLNSPSGRSCSTTIMITNTAPSARRSRRSRRSSFRPGRARSRYDGARDIPSPADDHQREALKIRTAHVGRDQLDRRDPAPARPHSPGASTTALRGHDAGRIRPSMPLRVFWRSRHGAANWVKRSSAHRLPKARARRGRDHAVQVSRIERSRFRRSHTAYRPCAASR